MDLSRMQVDEREQNNIQNSDEAKEERKHFLRIINAFRQYRVCSLVKLARTEKYVSELPKNHQELLVPYEEHLRRVADCVARNDDVIQHILKYADSLFETNYPTLTNLSEINIGPPTVSEIDKVIATIKQFVRDWSVNGLEERSACYNPILEVIVDEFSSVESKNEVQILVPGAGLGRLVFEIARKGFSCQGNEFSLFMLLASNFVLNKCKGTNLYSIFPWVSQTINVLKAEDQIEEIWFPDINPEEKPAEAEISMAAGDFLEIYTESNTWDCVATCFFIDCAHNIVQFVETIYKILKPGGLWINLGPLLYHFADMRLENSIEPSYDLLRDIITKFGFIFEKEDTKVKTTYTQNPSSMMQYSYESVFFVCRKPKNTSSS